MALIQPNMSMSEVVEENTSLIPVINRLGIRLGLQDKTVREVCEDHQIDTDFLLIIINTFLNEEYFPEKRLQAFHVSQIIDYLNKTNQYYLRFQIPNIAKHLDLFITHSESNNATLNLIGKFFQSFKEHLTEQIKKDESEWFPYCLQLSGQLQKSISFNQEEIRSFSDQETNDDSLEAVLADLKSIMIKHLSGDFNENLCYAVIFAVNSLEKDIKQHNRIRYRILSPIVHKMELLVKTR